MDSTALETFVAIHRAGGFSGAAALLGRTQPAISRRIALLEEELEAPLFARTASGVVLSEAGRALLPHAQRVLAALQDAHDVVHALHARGAGPLSIATVGTLAGAELMAAFRRIVEAAPAVEISLRTATSVEVSELVRSGEATIGLRYFDDPSPDLEARQLRPEKLAVACGPAHPRAGTRVRGLLDLRDEHWLAFPRARHDASAVHVFAQFLVRGVAEIRWSAVDSLTAQKRLIEAGLGIALLPERGIREERAAGTLATIRVADLDAANPVVAITRRGGYLSAAARSFLGILMEEL